MKARSRATTFATSELQSLIQEAASARQLLDEAQALVDERRKSGGGGAEEALAQAHQLTSTIVNMALSHDVPASPRGGVSSTSSAQVVNPRPSPLKQRSMLKTAVAILRTAMHLAQHPPFAASLLLAHHSARHLWTSNPHGPLACTMEWERFKKAFLGYAKEVSPTSKELDMFCRALTDTTTGGKQQPQVTLVRLAQLTDRWGLIGFFLRLTRSELMPPMGGEVIVIEGVNEKDLQLGEPVRTYLDSCGTVFRYRAVKNGVAIEFEEEQGVMHYMNGEAKEKGPLAKKAIFAHPAETVDSLAKISGTKSKIKKKDTSTTALLLEESLSQHKLLEDEIKALEKRVQCEYGEEADRGRAEIHRKREQMKWFVRILDVLSPPSAGATSIATSTKDKKSRRHSLSEAKAKRLTLDLTSIRKNSALSADPISVQGKGESLATSSSHEEIQDRRLSLERAFDPLITIHDKELDPRDPTDSETAHERVMPPPLPTRSPTQSQPDADQLPPFIPLPSPLVEPQAPRWPQTAISSSDSSTSLPFEHTASAPLTPQSTDIIPIDTKEPSASILSSWDPTPFTLTGEIDNVFGRMKALEAMFRNKESELMFHQSRLQEEHGALQDLKQAVYYQQESNALKTSEVERRQRKLEEKEGELAQRELRAAEALQRCENMQRELSRREADCLRMQREQEDEQIRLREERELLRKDRQRQMNLLMQAEQDRESREQEAEELFRQRQQLLRNKEDEFQKRQLQLIEREFELRSALTENGSVSLPMASVDFDGYNTAQDRILQLEGIVQRKQEEIAALNAQLYVFPAPQNRIDDVINNQRSTKREVGKLHLCSMCKTSVSSSLEMDRPTDPRSITFPMVKGQFPAHPITKHTGTSEKSSTLESALPPVPVFYPKSRSNIASPPVVSSMASSLPPPLPLPTPPSVDSVLYDHPPHYESLDYERDVITVHPMLSQAPEDLPPPPLPSPFCSPRPFASVEEDNSCAALLFASPPPPPPPPLLFNPAAFSASLTMGTLERLSTIPDMFVLRMQQIVRGWLFRRRAKRLTCWVSGSDIDLIRTRNRAFRELVESERTYIECLEDCKEAYMNPMFSAASAARSLGESLISEDQVKEIFGDYDLILQVNRRFIAELEEAAREWHTRPHAGPILQAWTPVMKLYVGYVKNYEQNEAALQRNEKRTRFAALMRECKSLSANRRGLSLTAYLIMPIQRVARYRLLGQEILRHTPEHHQDRAAMEVAMQRLEELCALINESKRDADNRKMSLQLITTRMIGAPVSLASPSRVFIMEGLLSVLDTRARPYYCFLFNDLFVRTKKKRKGYVWKGETALANVSLVDLADSPTRLNSFQILSEWQGRAATIVVCAPTSVAKDEWMLAISLHLIAPTQQGSGGTTLHSRPASQIMTNAATSKP